MLQMLVNREGFIPDVGFENLKDLIRRGIDLSVRLRASVESSSSSQVSIRQESNGSHLKGIDQRMQSAELVMRKLTSLVRDQGIEVEGLETELVQATDAIKAAQEVVLDGRREQATLRVAASVGTQLAAFAHEMNALLGQAHSLAAIADRLVMGEAIPRSARRAVSELRSAITELINQLERHVSFLTDVVGANARRRRRRLPVRQQIESALQLLWSRVERRNQSIEIGVADDLRTPPMFSSELMSIVMNLLSNAVKAAGEEGAIWVKGERVEAYLELAFSNTGDAVDLANAERWFRPYESTTTDIDEVLGQGMGLGLAIVRRIVEEYGGTVRFTPPHPPYATNVQIRIPYETP